MQRSPFTCAEEVRADQTRELGAKVLKPKTRDPRGPLSRKSLQKEAPPTKSSTEAGPENVPALDHSEDGQGPRPGR